MTLISSNPARGCPLLKLARWREEREESRSPFPSFGEGVALRLQLYNALSPPTTRVKSISPMLPQDFGWFARQGLTKNRRAVDWQASADTHIFLGNAAP